MAKFVDEQRELNPDSPLGTIRKIRVPKLPDDDERIIESTAEKRYRLQALAREIVGVRDKRLYGCLRRIAPGFTTVEIRRNPQDGSAHYLHLEQCNRVWTCPVCSARISNKRRKELSEALAAAKLAGYMPLMVTYTLRHDYRDKFNDLLDGLLTALRKFKSGRAYQNIKDEYDIIGGIRVLEPTYGENGWHPHAHELVFLKRPVGTMALGGLDKWMTDHWVTTLRSLDFDASYEHGLHIETADSKIADYILKFGREPHESEWGVEHELAAAGSKSAHRDGLTPFQLLECFGGGDDRAGKLFDEYALVMAGRRQLVWSPGLRALLKLPEELDEEQLPLIEETETTFTAVEIDPANWSKVVTHGLRGGLLWLVAAGDWPTLRALLKKRGIEATICEERPEYEPYGPPEPMPYVVNHDPVFTQPVLMDVPVNVRYE